MKSWETDAFKKAYKHQLIICEEHSLYSTFFNFSFVNKTPKEFISFYVHSYKASVIHQIFTFL